MNIDQYEVVVDNIGTVYVGDDIFRAHEEYKAYRQLSDGGYGRAGGGRVVLMRNGEVVKEWNEGQTRPRDDEHT